MILRRRSLSMGPWIGSKPDGARDEEHEGKFVGINRSFFPEKLPNYNDYHFYDGVFHNEIGDPHPPPMVQVKGIKMIEFLTHKDVVAPLPSRNPINDFSQDSGIHAWWLSHSTILIQIGTAYIITDPIFDRSASPVDGVINRVTPPPCEIADLPPISFVLISHAHWDHLCEHSVKELAHRFPSAHFLAPRGVAEILSGWGVHVIEFDWRTHLSISGIDFFCFPAYHGSARWIGDKDKALWCSWIISYDNRLIYFPGDTAVGPHFSAIREYFGRGVDLMFGPIGPQDPPEMMRAVHLDGTGMLQMANAIEAKVVVPIHYGTFPLGFCPVESDLDLTKRVWGNDDRLIALEVGGRVDWSEEKFIKGQ